jgi:hypothetical protein
MKFDRRHFLAAGGVVGAGLLLKDATKLSEQIASGVISNAKAESLGTKRVFSIFAQSAVPNWMFNLCLYPDAEVIPSANRIEGVGTGFDSNGNTIFTQQKRGDYWFPNLWFTKIPTTSGAWVSPASLLDSMLTIRGMWNPTDGHQISNRTMYKPLGANNSVHGVVADATASLYPIPAIVSANSLIAKEFTSSKGINPISSYSPLSALTTIRDSFKEQVSLFRSNASLDALVTNALAKMDANSNFKQSASNYNRKKAEELIRANLANIVTSYNTKLAKYNALLTLACKYDSTNADSSIPGIFDVALTNYTSVHWNPDNPNDINRYFQTGNDLRDLFLTAPQISSVAESFAMTEVLFENNLNANVISNISGMNTISPIVLRKDTNMAYASNLVNWGYDNGHSMGLSVQTLLWTVYFRGFLACMYEFVSFLKTNNMYNDTVITFSSDFARSPQASGKASDHGWQANATSMWCGEITSPIIIGNTYLDATTPVGSSYKGCWGVGRTSTYLANKIGIGNMNATMASLIGVAANTTNNKSLIKKTGSSIVPLEGAKTT